MTAVLSVSARRRLQSQLERLLTVERPAVAAAAVTSETVGDAADVALRAEALMDLERIDLRIAHLQSVLAAPQASAVAPDSTVAAGRIVTLRFGDDPTDERFLFGIIEEREGDLEVVTADSPLGRALLGARAGSDVRYRPRPDRPELAVHVVEVVDVLA